MKYILIILAFISIGIGAYYFIPRSVPQASLGESSTFAQEMNAQVLPADEQAVPSDQRVDDVMKIVDAGVMDEENNAAMMKKDAPVAMEAKARGTYEPYSEDKLAAYGEDKIILFFHAAWCPICVSLEKEILASSDAIPSGVHALVVDYDNAQSLRQKYGVTIQHTFVQVDSTGSAIQKFSDAFHVSDVVSRLK